MGKIVYGDAALPSDIEDRVLAHLRVVFMNKLRRSEPFFFHHATASGTRSVWIHPSIPIVFHFYGSRPPAINRAWVDAMMREANGAYGLTVVPEPDESTPPAAQV